MSATVTRARPSHIRTALFPNDRLLEEAVRSLVEQGWPEDLMGVAIRHEGTCLLTVVASPGQELEADQRLQDLGATLVGGSDELPEQYGAPPHPGVREDHDLKLPMGRDFPASSWAPAIAGYRVRPAVLDPGERIWSFKEVEAGYFLEDGLSEADRCLGCPDPPCMQGCPAHNHIPDFIAALRREDFAGAAGVLRQTTNFPGICGRVCDKARQCEGSCVLGQEGGDPVAIGLLERFVADWELQAGLRRSNGARTARTGHQVAIIGSGPSGLAAAEQLAQSGHGVTVFEALPVLGGALAWGIPTFRLPQHVLNAELEFLRSLGVAFRLNTRVGANITVQQLLHGGFDAVFLGAGATIPVRMGIPGEDLEGIYSSTDFLSMAKLARLGDSGEWKAPVIGQRLAVIGAGNTAMDVAQTAVRLSFDNLQELSSKQATIDVAETAARLGFREVTVVYRRSEAEMPARREEIEGAREEGVQFRFLTAPVRFIGQNGRLTAMECVEMTLQQPDSRGRPSPTPRPGSEFIIEVDTVVLALGYQVDPTIVDAVPGIQASLSGTVIVDRSTGRTSRPGVWAGGDIVEGPDTVVRAMVAGRQAAADIDRYIQAQAANRKGVPA